MGVQHSSEKLKLQLCFFLKTFSCFFYSFLTGKTCVERFSNIRDAFKKSYGKQMAKRSGDAGAHHQSFINMHNNYSL